MEAVEVRKALDGGYWLTARTDSLAEAMRGVDALLAIPSAAFDAAREAVLGPVDFPVRIPTMPDELAGDDDPALDALNVDKPLTPPGVVGN